jgi:hypothetical protein
MNSRAPKGLPRRLFQPGDLRLGLVLLIAQMLIEHHLRNRERVAVGFAELAQQSQQRTSGGAAWRSWFESRMITKHQPAEVCYSQVVAALWEIDRARIWRS